MSDIIEILGEKKFIGSRNKELSTRLVLEENKKIQYDNNLFYNVSQQDQYLTEKNNSKTFRFYGKINPIINLNVYEKTINGDAKIELNKDIFDINLDNWSIVILKSKRIESNFNANGNQLYSKGVKNLNVRRGGLTIFNANLTNGLPAQMFTSKDYTENYGLYLPLGHNFIPGDKIKITSNDRYGLSNGFYEVVFVDGDKIFIDTPPKKSIYFELGRTSQLSVDLNTIRNAINENTIALPNDYLKTVQLSKSNIDELLILKDNITYDNGTFQNIRGLDVKIKDAAKITKEKRPKIQLIIKPQYYVSKVIEKELLEYYVKVLEVVDVIEELDTCAFSVNSYDNSNINFFLNRNTNIDNLYNNLNEPVSDLYIGIIKNSPTTSFNLLTNLPPFSSVESHFSRFINYVGDNDGIEKITDNAVSNKVKIGDFFYHSVCEHSTENLQEVEVDMLHHRFIHNDIIFTYKPFYKINLKLKSTYIEDSDTIQSTPNYAIHSRQRDKYIWRDIFDIGVSDENGNKIDFPFMNGSFYVYNNFNFFVTPEPRATRKYDLNKNDITSDGSKYTNEILSIFDDLNLKENDIKGIKPYNKYKDRRC
jgi:Zn-finger protein